MVGGGDRMICLRSDDERREDGICRVVAFREEPLEVSLSHFSFVRCWSEMCNNISFRGFLSRVNQFLLHTYPPLSTNLSNWYFQVKPDGWCDSTSVSKCSTDKRSRIPNFIFMLIFGVFKQSPAEHSTRRIEADSLPKFKAVKGKPYSSFSR